MTVWLTPEVTSKKEKKGGGKKDPPKKNGGGGNYIFTWRCDQGRGHGTLIFPLPFPLSEINMFAYA